MGSYKKSNILDIFSDNRPGQCIIIPIPGIGDHEAINYVGSTLGFIATYTAPTHMKKLHYGRLPQPL